MIKKRAPDDRRCETRYPLPERLTWRKPGSDQAFMAWMSDTSRTSSSFVTSAQRVEFGEVIELVSLGGPPQRCRITRITPYGRGLSLIACRSIDSESEPGNAGTL